MFLAFVGLTRVSKFSEIGNCTGGGGTIYFIPEGTKNLIEIFYTCGLAYIIMSSKIFHTGPIQNVVLPDRPSPAAQ